MAQGKWIPDLTGSTPVEEAARETLKHRLDAIEKALAPSMEASSPDPEPVHQLRVGARRATVALDLFAACWPGKVYRKARRRLRDLRRSAGEARDWDVFLLGLEAHATGQRPTGFLIGYAHGQRSAAQAILVDTASKFASRLDANRLRICKCMKAPDGRPTLLDLARATLTDLLAQLRDSTQPAPKRLEELHRVRILGKELRYSMEIFASCFRTPFREEIYPRVEGMQEILGALNDSRVALANLALLRERLKVIAPKHWRRVSPEVVAWMRFHQDQLKRHERRFARWLEQWHRASSDAELESLIESADSDEG